MEPLPDQSVMIMEGARRVKRSHDQMFPFWQFGDFSYLSGWDEPDAILVITKNNQKVTSILFHTGDNEHETRWHGSRVTHQEAKAYYQFDEALPRTDFDAWLKGHAKKFEQVYSTDTSQDYRSLSLLKKQDTTRLNHELTRMRVIKEAGEIELIQKACQITAKAHIETMQANAKKRFKSEQEVAATFQYRAMMNGADGLAYESIAASGQNACILHYTENNQIIEPQQCLLLDAGCTVGHYAGDVSRTWPVTGQFTNEQRAIYDLVLQAHQACIQDLKPGVSYLAIQQKSQDILLNGLMDLGVVDKHIDTDDWFMSFYGHGIGHSLGLDVHDPSPKRQAFILEENMVLTIEPGLYIQDSPLLKDKRFCNIGVRIEDNILIQKGGSLNLTQDVPVESKDIEHLVSQ